MNILRGTLASNAARWAAAVALVTGGLTGAAAPATAAQAEAKAGALATCNSHPTDLYGFVGTRYPFSYAGRTVTLHNGTQRHYTWARVLGGIRVGDQLILQRATRKIGTDSWVTSAEVGGTSTELCSARVNVVTGVGTPTPAMYNLGYPIRACLYPVEGGGYCHNYWYQDLS